MKIALPTRREGTIDAHFGHCEYYTLYTISEEKEVTKIETLASPQGCGCKSNIAGTLEEQGVTLMLAGNIGTGAIQVLNNHQIQVIRGCSGETSKVVDAFLKNMLVDSGITCDHTHEEGHNCNHQA